jgi:signal transduction histidine kinase/ABC-type amino acid transport substrate-binding protein
MKWFKLWSFVLAVSDISDRGLCRLLTKWRRAWIAFAWFGAGLSLCLLLACSLPGTVRAEELQVMRVGYVQEPGYFYKNDQGEYQGYIIDLLYNIASHGKFTVQVVDFTNYEDEDQALREGLIDMEAVLGYSAARAKQFLYSDSVTANVPLTILVRADNERYRFGDFQALSGMRIGLIKSEATGDIFIEWCQKSKLKPQLIYYQDNETQQAALLDGSVDGIVSTMEDIKDGRILLYYGHMPCYAIFNLEREDLKLLFDMSLRQTLADNPQLLEQLHNEHLPASVNNLDLTTPEEKALVARHPDVTVAVQEYDPPYIYLDQSGKLRGILPDYYDWLGKETGLRFKYRAYPTAAAAMAAVQQGKAQVLGLYSGSQAFAYRERMRLISVAGTGSLIRVDRYGKSGGNKAAVIARNLSLLQQRLAGQGYQLEPYPDIEACYVSLKAGQVDCLLCSDTMANWLFNNYRMEGYSMVPLAVQQKIYTAIPYSGDDALFGLLSKGAVRGASHYNGIVIANVTPRDNFSSVLARLPFWGLVGFAGVMGALVILLIILVVVLTRRYREKTQLAVQEAENEKEKIRLEALEKNAEEKNQFFANISHDLRTPLNAILGFAHLAVNSGEEEQVRTYLKKISSAGQLMLELVNDTLTMSKLKSGKLELKQTLLPADPRELFQPVFDSVRELTFAKQIQLSVRSEWELGERVQGDQLNLRKILLNLLSNAVKYTPAGGHIQVRFWNEKAADGGLDCLLSVQDDGIGIAPEFQARVFEPFSQEKRQGYESSGTGLGLAIVKQLVVLMGGTITLKSVKDQGSTFTIRMRLPLAPEQSSAGVAAAAGKVNAAGAAVAAEKVSGAGAAAAAEKVSGAGAAAAAEQVSGSGAGTTNPATGAAGYMNGANAPARNSSAASETEPSLAGLKVLLCEDNAMNQEIACALLKSQGVTTVTAENGRLGLELFAASAPGTFDAILMDLRMPEMDGYEATRQIRSLSRADARSLPIIALTAETFAEDIEKCLEAGMNDHVAKPLVPKVLFSTLAKYTKR